MASVCWMCCLIITGLLYCRNAMHDLTAYAGEHLLPLESPITSELLSFLVTTRIGCVVPYINIFYECPSLIICVMLIDVKLHYLTCPTHLAGRMSFPLVFCLPSVP